MYNPSTQPQPTVKRLNNSCQSALWYGQLGCTGNIIMHIIYNHVIGIDRPLRKNPFYRCPCCLPNKMSKRCLKKTTKKAQKNTKKALNSEKSSDTQYDPLHDDNTIKGESGQHFHMDFGLVRGSAYKVKNENGPTITSIDGFNSYLIIVDRVIRYIWIFLTTSKAPPINIAQRVLNKFKSNNPHRTVRTDQGGELA